MPFHVAPLNRRRFLLGSAGFAAGLLLSPPTGAKDQDPDRWALLSDQHIPADAEQVSRGNKMAENLRRVAAEIPDFFLDTIATCPLLPPSSCKPLDGNPADSADARKSPPSRRLAEPPWTSLSRRRSAS